MADITMCKGTNCPVSLKCRRYTSKADPYRQSYFSEVPYENNRCDYYWGEDAESIFNKLKEIVGKNESNNRI